MIDAVAFCPHPPVLIPELAQGAAPELAELRRACRAAVTATTSPGHAVVVLGAGPTSAVHRTSATGSFAGYGVPLTVPLDGADGARSAATLPLSLTVGAWLLRDAVGPTAGTTGIEVGPDFAGSEAEATWHALRDASPVVVLATGDGSARRSTAAPGYLDERAGGFDRRVADALAAGSPDALRTAADGADGLLAAGAPVWAEVARATAGAVWAAEVLHDDAPYGVGYLVAAWTRTP